jgi:hypothetical protein
MQNEVVLAKMGRVTGHPEKRYCPYCEKMQDWFKGSYCGFCAEHKFVKYDSNSYRPDKDSKYQFDQEFKKNKNGHGGRKPKTKKGEEGDGGKEN